MWCGASASTRIHETVRHTWRFDFDSSNSFSVVLSSAVWNMSSRKKSVFVLFCFCFLLLCQPALLDTFMGPCVVFVIFPFSFFLFFLVCFVFFWCSLFHLTSDLAHFRVQFRSCFTVHPPLLPDILTFTHFPKLTRRLHTPNKSILHSLYLKHHSEMWQLIEALKTCRLLLMFLVHYGSRRPDPEYPTTVCMCCCLTLCVARA